MKFSGIILLMVLSTDISAQQMSRVPYYMPIVTKSTSSFRGLSVVSDKVAWISGSKGTIGRSTDSGSTWRFMRPTGYENIDFRDVEAFDSNRAIVISAGSPAYILRTENAGETWLMCYENKDSNIFFDGFDFWNDKEGIAFGDPINGKFKILRTSDGGLTWTEPTMLPEAKSGEAAFAASGTSIRTWGSAEAAFVTGGSVSRLFYSRDKGYTWESFMLPIQQGSSSQGAYTFSVKGGRLYIAGGNYTKPDSAKNILVFNLKNKKAEMLQSAPDAYISCVEQGPKTLIAVGLTGTYISKDGKNWVKKDHAPFNAVRKAKKGKLVLAVGDRGRIARIINNY